MFEHTMDSANLPAPQSSGHIVVPTEGLLDSTIPHPPIDVSEV